MAYLQNGTKLNNSIFCWVQENICKISIIWTQNWIFLEIALPISDVMEWFLYFSSKPEWRNNFNYAFELIHFVLAYTLRQQVKIWTNQYVFIFKLSSFDIYKNQSNFDKIIISVWLKQNMKLNSDLWSSHIKWKKYLFYPWLMMCSHEI